MGHWDFDHVYIVREKASMFLYATKEREKGERREREKVCVCVIE